MTELKGEPPEEGDFAICIKCAKLAVFDEDLQQRKLTMHEMALLCSDQDTWDMVKRMMMTVKQMYH